MATIIRNRIIRPSSRLETSKSYKIDTKNVDSGDTLFVNIDHESKSFYKTYTFKGSDVKDRSSISFRVNDYGTHIDISWSGANPEGYSKTGTSRTNRQTSLKKSINKPISGADVINSLPPISDTNSVVLILGTMPGVESLKQQSYYSHPRNLFWKIMGEILQCEIPASYDEKKKFLVKNKIALWDMCKACIREGSLDSNISNEIPNDIVRFASDHPDLKAIAFNGKEAARLFGKHFGSILSIKLLVMPSTSPANAGIQWESKVKEWNKLKDFI